MSLQFGNKGQGCLFSGRECRVFIGPREQIRAGNFLPGKLPQCELQRSLATADLDKSVNKIRVNLWLNSYSGIFASLLAKA